MADPFHRRGPPQRGPQPSSGLSANQYAQPNTFQAPGAFGQGSYGYQQHSAPDYQQAHPSTYNQPNQYGYQQPNPGGYQQASQQDFQQNYGNPNYPPQTSYGSHAGYQTGVQGGGFAPQNDIMADFTTGLIRSQGETYFHKGQAYVQSRLGFLSTGDLHYLFDIDGAYVLDKVLLLLLPFFSSRSFARKGEQISGGHRYQPPRKDVFAPDLYIPSMSICTYVVLLGIVQFHHGKFSPEGMYLMGSSALTGWAIQWLVIKTTLYLLSVTSSMPVLEILAYAGYPFFYACLGVVASLVGGVWPYRAVLGYGTVAMATFLIRVMKHVLFQDKGHGGGAARHNYILLGLGIFQLPFLLWFHA